MKFIESTMYRVENTPEGKEFVERVKFLHRDINLIVEEYSTHITIIFPLQERESSETFYG